jgi:hypothetical protein
MDVLVWLRSLGLERYEAAFRENEIDERVLPSLTLEDLKEIGVGPVGHRRMLLEAIAALRDDTGSNAPSADMAIMPRTCAASWIGYELQASRMAIRIGCAASRDRWSNG